MPPQHAFRSDLPVLYARGAWRHLRRADGIGMGVWLLPGTSDEGTGPKRSEETGAEERPRFRVLQYSTRVQDNPATSDEVPGRSVAT